MNIMSTKTYGLLYEAAKTEAMLNDDVAFAIDIKEATEELDSIEELEEDIDIAPDMVDVIEQYTSNGKLYLVEAERLCRYMDCCGLELGDLGKAIKDVAHANGVDINNIALVIESGDVIDDIITEAKKVRSKSLVPATRLKHISDLSKKAKSIGIKVVKRKSKRKSKKRRHLSIGKISIN